MNSIQLNGESSGPLGDQTADVAGAERFWREVTGAEAARFHRATLKRHNPRTVRKNVGANYHGCLIVSVRQGADLYRRIEGWVGAIMAGGHEAEQSDSMGPGIEPV